MKRRSNILGIMGVSLFVVFLTMNLTISGFYKGDKTLVQLTLIELAAKAQSADENGWYGEGTPYWSEDSCIQYGYNGCHYAVYKCAWDGFSVCDVSLQRSCSDLCYY